MDRTPTLFYRHESTMHLEFYQHYEAGQCSPLPAGYALLPTAYCLFPSPLQLGYSSDSHNSQAEYDLLVQILQCL